MSARSTFVLLAALAGAFLTAPSQATPPPDGPGELAFHQGSFHAHETDGIATIRVRRQHGDDGEVSVTYATADGTAVAGDDYAATTGTLTWADGDSSDKTFTINIINDGISEGGETVELALSDPTGGAELSDNHATARLVITGGGDCPPGEPGCFDDNGVFRFDQSTFHGLEPVGIAVITVSRRHGDVGEVSVAYATSDGTAVAGEDYVATSGVLTWADGDSDDKTFVVEVIDDGIQEGGEKALLTLSNPTGGAVLSEQHSTAHLLITGNNGSCGGALSGRLRFAESSAQVIEDAGVAVVTVERACGDQGAVTVDFAASEGSATNGLDFTAVSGTLSWADGDGSVRTFEIPILQDILEEGNESVMLALTNATGGAEIDPGQGSAILEILDDDAPIVACQPGAETLCLLGGRFAAEITYRTPNVGTGRGRAVALSTNSGLFWFFDADNAEMLLKVIDGCGAPGLEAYWVFYAATTNVDFTLRVTDTETGVVKAYANPFGLAAPPVQDVVTFRCP